MHSLQINGKDNNKEKLDKIKDIIIDYFIKNELDVFVLIIHDMSKMKSSAFKIFKDGIETIEYDQYTSRGNIIIPELEKELIKHNFEINKIKDAIDLKIEGKNIKKPKKKRETNIKDLMTALEMSLKNV